MPTEIRNRILGEVFGMLPEEDEDELPFRVLDDEMESFGMQSAANAESSGIDGIDTDNTPFVFGLADEDHSV